MYIVSFFIRYVCCLILLSLRKLPVLCGPAVNVNHHSLLSRSVASVFVEKYGGYSK